MAAVLINFVRVTSHENALYMKTPKFNSCWRQQKCADSAQCHCGLYRLAFVEPSESVQINCYGAMRLKEGWIYIVHRSNLWKRSLITLKRCKYSLTKICVWSQLEFLYDFRVAVLQPVCCTESTCKFQMNVYLSLAIPILCRCGIIVGWNL